MPITKNEASFSITNITYAALSALKDAGTMAVGYYRITDVADDGVIIFAASSSELSTDGIGIFLDPDFQGIGEYPSGLYTQLGIWHAGLSPSLLTEMCIWNGVHWVYAGGGNSEPGTDVNWTEFTKADQIAGSNLGYIRVDDFVTFDFENNAITRRVDKRGNDVRGAYNYQTFQWGDNDVSNNTIIGTVNCLNSVCASIKGNIIENNISLNLNVLPVDATFDNNYICNSDSLGSSAFLVTLNPAFTIFSGNKMHCVANTDFTSSTQSGITGKSLIGSISTFEEQFDLNGGTEIDISGSFSYLGVIQVQDNSLSTPTVANLTTIIGLNFNIDRVFKIIPDICQAAQPLILRVNNGIGSYNIYCTSSDKLLRAEKGDWLEFSFQTRNNGSRRLYQSAEGIYGVGTSIGASDITYAALLVLYNAGTMTPGFYNVTDRADNGIRLQAFSSSKLSPKGVGLFLNPDFQNVGVYSGVLGLTGVAYTSTQGVWLLANEGSYTDGMVVFDSGLHYQVIDDSAFNGDSPSINPTAYQELTKVTPNVGYIEECDVVEFDLVTDTLLKRCDKRRNQVTNSLTFQWGNNVVTDNLIRGELNNINSASTECIGNEIGPGVLLNANSITSPSQTNRNIIKASVGYYGGAIPIQVFIHTGLGYFCGNIMTVDTNIDFSNTTIDPATGYFEARRGSNYVENITITGLTTLDLGVFSEYVGELLVTSGGATETINLFANFKEFVPIRIYPSTGLIITFTHGTGANQPTCAGAINAIIDGTTGDWIEFTKKGTRIYQTGGETY
jgi:hypothetical protein